MTTTDAARSLAIRIEAQADLHFFTRYAFAQRKGYKWKDNWHHKLICDALMRVFRGECKRLIVNIPPRYSKTEIAVVNFIAWALGNHPDCEFIHSSYSARLAANNSVNARSIVGADWYQRIFPGTLIEQGANSREHWQTTAGGVVYTAGAGGTITGFGAGKLRDGFGGAIIIDDPHKADEATSDTMRTNVIEWFQNTIESRLNSPQTPIIVIMQRLHEEDLAGWLLAGGNGEEWEYLCIPAINDQDEALWSFKHDLDTLKRMEQSSPYVFAGQYMQRPAPLAGGIFKKAWWQYYNPAALPRVKRIIQSWDTAFKTKAENDFSVCETWAECDDGYYLLDLWKGKEEFPNIKRIALSLAAKYVPHAILIEDKASGQSLIQELRRETNLPVVPVQVDTDKVTRAYAVTPIIESKRVFLPEGAPWVPSFIDNHGAFPNAKHDDDVDSTTQALNYLARGGGNMGMFEFIKQQADDIKRMRDS